MQKFRKVGDSLPIRNLQSPRNNYIEIIFLRVSCQITMAKTQLQQDFAAFRRVDYLN